MADYDVVLKLLALSKWTVLSLTIVVILYLGKLWRDSARPKDFPPGPKGLPILGAVGLQIWSATL